MKKTIIIITTLIVAIASITGYILYKRNSAEEPVNIIAADQKVKIKDAKMFLKGFPAQSANEDPREYFSDEIVNVYTVRFFKFIQTEIDYTTREDHLKAVKAYLLSVLDPHKALEMFALYEKFLDYEIGLSEKMKSWSYPSTNDEFLRYLQTVQNYRREIFGTSVADAMWGAEVKAREYSIRKNVILFDQNLYGEEKERKIRDLNEEMWGEEAGSLEEPPQTDPEKFTSYQEKQALYQRDIQELPPEQRREKINEFRKEYFSAEQIARLEKVDAELEAEKQKEAQYQLREKAIQNNPSLDPNQKAQAIRELQDNLFGEDADALRRRLNIQRGLK
jgi:lipase chaperone LimK